jgi:hypothetical protein
MSTCPTLESLKLLSAAIEAKEEKLDISLTLERKKLLSEQLQLLLRRFGEEYSKFLLTKRFKQSTGS